MKTGKKKSSWRVKMGIAAVVLAVCASLGCSTVKSVVDKLPSVLSEVVADIQKGESPTQIEDDVANMLAGQVGVDATVILQDVVQIVIDSHVFGDGMPQAKSAEALKAHNGARLAARGK
jgi:outer membrane murein-binding lipoprotein Lpp